MTDHDQPANPPSGSVRWDPAEVLRLRAEQTRRERDDAIAGLRELMSDEQVLEEFGIDLGAVEQ